MNQPYPPEFKQELMGSWSPAKRTGDWTTTFSGIMFWPLDPRSEEIYVMDICHALSNMCRFNGHSVFHYSVALHTLYGLLFAEDIDVARYWLIHDNAEAYMGDIIRPIKIFIPEFTEAEYKLMSCIFKKFNMKQPSNPVWDAVTEIDNRMLMTEALQLFPNGNHVHNWSIYGAVDGYDLEIVEYLPSYIKKVFLEVYDLLILKGNFRDAKDRVEKLRTDGRSAKMRHCSSCQCFASSA